MHVGVGVLFGVAADDVDGLLLSLVHEILVAAGHGLHEPASVVRHIGLL